MRYLAKSSTRTISALTGTHLPLGGEKQLQLSVLLRDTRVTTGIWTHTLLNRSSRAWDRCSYPLGHDTPLTQRESSADNTLELLNLNAPTDINMHAQYLCTGCLYAQFFPCNSIKQADLLMVWSSQSDFSVARNGDICLYWRRKYEKYEFIFVWLEAIGHFR